MAPNWLTRSSSHPAAAAVGGENTKEAIEAFVDFFEAKDLNQALESFGKLCQSLNLVPGLYPLQSCLSIKVFCFNEVTNKLVPNGLCARLDSLYAIRAESYPTIGLNLGLTYFSSQMITWLAE